MIFCVLHKNSNGPVRSEKSKRAMPLFAGLGLSPGRIHISLFFSHRGTAFTKITKLI